MPASGPHWRHCLGWDTLTFLASCPLPHRGLSLRAMVHPILPQARLHPFVSLDIPAISSFHPLAYSVTVTRSQALQARHGSQVPRFSAQCLAGSRPSVSVESLLALGRGGGGFLEALGSVLAQWRQWPATLFWAHGLSHLWGRVNDRSWKMWLGDMGARGLTLSWHNYFLSTDGAGEDEACCLQDRWCGDG